MRGGWTDLHRGLNQPRTGLPLDAMWERHYAFEWMGAPPDIAAQQRLQRVMETPPEYQRRGWVEFDRTRSRYAKT